MVESAPPPWRKSLMRLTRFNAVGMITGAATGLGPACAADLARTSQGGLVLVDADEAALERIADDLMDTAPERVSMLAFDVGDPDRWAQASDFIRNQYGRLDWAIVNTAATLDGDPELVQWRRVLPVQLEAVLRTLRVLLPMMAQNSMGGAVVVTAPVAALSVDRGVKAGLAHLVRAASIEGAPGGVRVNAVATAGQGSPLWKKAPAYAELLKQSRGDEEALSGKIAKLSAPVVRHDAPPAQLIMTLLSDDTPLSGATLLVDDAAKA